MLKHLTIENFSGLPEVALDFTKPVTMITGENNSGKSSIRDALLWAVTGLTREVTKKNMASLLAYNGGKLRVVVELQDGWKFSRTLHSCSASEAELRERFGAPEVFAACMDAFDLMDRSPRERAELVKAVASRGPALVQAWTALGLKLPEDGSARVEELLAANQLDKAEAYAVESRREAKRRLADLPEAPPSSKLLIQNPDGEKREIDLEAGNLEEMQALLAQLETERDAAVREEGRAQAADMPEALERDIAEAEARLAKLAQFGPGEEARLSAELREAEKGRDEAAAVVATCRARYEGARKRYADAERLKDKCPCCGQRVQKATLAGLLKAIQEEGNSAGTERETAEARQIELGARATQLHARQEAIRRDGMEAAGLGVTISSLRVRLAEQAHGAPKPDPGKAAGLKARIAVGNLVCAAKVRYSENLHAWNNRAELEATVQGWDSAAGALGPEGAVRRAATAGFSVPTVVAHARMLFGEPELDVQVLPDWVVTLRGRVRLSRSERWRLGACFSAALSEAAGLNMLILDECDILDPRNRELLTAWIESLAGQFDRVVLLATGDEALESGLPWLETRQVVEGRLQ